MRKLFILRGAPASGKDTLIKTLGLERYAVSYDSIRRALCPVSATDSGHVRVCPHFINTTVAQVAREAVEFRMRLGDTVILNNTNVKAKNTRSFRDLARMYDYSVVDVNVQGAVSLEELLVRNSRRGIDQVPESVIRDMWVLGAKTIPGELAGVTRRTFLEKVGHTRHERVTVFGDVHSCSHALEEAMLDHANSDWVFSGDLFDRGPDPVKVFQLLSETKHPYVLVEGNHETNLRAVVNGYAPNTHYAVTRKTWDELQKHGVTVADIHRVILDRLVPATSFSTGSTSVLVTHGGINCDGVEKYGDDLYLTEPVRYYTQGVSKRDDVSINRSTYSDFMGNVEPVLDVQIFGHRSGTEGVREEVIQPERNLYGLDSAVERGGHLTTATVEGDTVTIDTYKEEQ